MANQHIPVTGGCLCGAVRYESTAPPIRGYFCHCTICQKNYGGLFQTMVKFAGSAFAFTKGEPKHYRSSAYAQRGFCAACGSPLVFVYDGNPDVWILFGSLDHPEDWPLTRDAAWGQTEHVFIESKVPWYEINDGLPQNQELSSEMVARAAAIEYAASRW